MTFHDAQHATRTHDCTVPGCTGTATRAHQLCEWHTQHGTPDQILTPGATRPNLGRHKPPDSRRRERLEQRIRDLNIRIRKARAERDRLQDELDALT